MEQTSQQQTNSESTTERARETGKFINLRPYLGLRLGLFAVAMAVVLLYCGYMTFGNGTIETPEPTDPVVAQTAWQELVTDTLAAKGPTEEPVALPTTANQSIGLLPVRVASH